MRQLILDNKFTAEVENNTVTFFFTDDFCDSFSVSKSDLINLISNATPFENSEPLFSETGNAEVSVTDWGFLTCDFETKNGRCVGFFVLAQPVKEFLEQTAS